MLYGQRFRIEEMFRDQKDWRFGIAIGHLRLTRASGVERMLLVAAVVHLLAMLVGAEARRRRHDRTFRANTERKRRTHSDFTLGLFFATRMRWKRSKLLAKFWAEAVAEFGG